MGQLQRAKPQLAEMGYQIIAISPDRPEKLRYTNKKLRLDFPLLSDSKMAGARTFGIAFELDEKTLERYKSLNIDLEDASGENHHWLPVPSVFIIGTDGIIKFEYINPDYHVRINRDLLLAAASASLETKKE